MHVKNNLTHGRHAERELGQFGDATDTAARGTHVSCTDRDRGRDLPSEPSDAGARGARVSSSCQRMAE